MIFDDWGTPRYGNLTGGDSFLDNPLLSAFADIYGDYGFAGLDSPYQAPGQYEEHPGSAFGQDSVLDAIADAPFLVNDAPVATGDAPVHQQQSSFGMSYSMRLLIEISGGSHGYRSWR